jgi:hypothetical protein
MTFKDALHILSNNLILKIALPDWAKNLTKHTRKVNLAFMELKVRPDRACLVGVSYLGAAIHAGNGASSQECG